VKLPNFRKNHRIPKVEDDDSESEIDDGPEDMAMPSTPKIVGLADEIENIIEGIGGLNICSRVLRSALDDSSATEPLSDSLTASNEVSQCHAS